MKYDITLFIEAFALFGFICCILTLEAGFLLLGILISFVICEILIEWKHLKFKKLTTILYAILYISGTAAASISVSGSNLIAYFPALFITALLIVSHFISAPAVNMPIQQSKPDYKAM